MESAIQERSQFSLRFFLDAYMGGGVLKLGPSGHRNHVLTALRFLCVQIGGPRTPEWFFGFPANPPQRAPPEKVARRFFR